MDHKKLYETAVQKYPHSCVMDDGELCDNNEQVRTAYMQGCVDVADKILTHVKELIVKYGSCKTHNEVEEIIQTYRVMGYEDVKGFIEKM